MGRGVSGAVRIVRGFPLLVAALAMLGCDAGVDGTYALVSIDGQELPYSFELFGTVTVTSGSLVLRDSRYEITMVSADDDPVVETGSFIVTSSNVLRFTADPSPTPPPPPPPPPLPGDTVARRWFAPGDSGRREAGSSAPPEARWVGDQLILLSNDEEWVFRR